MLFELYLEYEDGTSETKIVTEDQTTIYPQRDKITHSGCKLFKYKIEKHSVLPKTIVRFLNKTMIYPAQIECHPKTTLNDIEEIVPLNQTPQIETQIEVKKEKLKEWKFESSSGGGTYTVKQTKTGKIICDCPGYFRARDREKGCKHIQEIRSRSVQD